MYVVSIGRCNHGPLNQIRYKARIQDFGKGGGAWGLGDKLAVGSSQVCTPGGSEGMPLGTFEILDAFSCNMVHILSQNYSFYLYSVDEGGGRAPPMPPGSAPGYTKFTQTNYKKTETGIDIID